MRHSLFTENMKLADLLLANYRLLYVFPYFDIALGFGETSVKQACEEKNISIDLFLLVCNVYSYPKYVPTAETLKKIPVLEMVVYLRKSHQDYIDNRIPHIIDHVYELVSFSPKKHGEMLVQFCEKYREDVTSHFIHEEEVVYPYITDLLNGVPHPTKRSDKGQGLHKNLETALHDLKNIIIKYLPENKKLEQTRANVLIYLFLFEADLDAHTRLENKILRSLIEFIENNDKE